MIIDLEFPHHLPQLKGRTPRVAHGLRVRTRGTRPSIGIETPLVPRAAAEAVWEEACQWVGEELPREWIAVLIGKAEAIYGRSTGFRRRLRGPKHSGREWLWAFMRHWLAALVLKHRPGWYARLPARYAVGKIEGTAQSLSEKGARLWRSPAAVRSPLPNTRELQKPLRLVEDDTAALRDSQTGSQG